MLDPHTIVELQSMIRDLIKSKVCELESQAAEVATEMPAYSKQLLHSAREMHAMQLEVFFLTNTVWNDSCEEVMVELKARIDKPELPDLTPVVPVQVVTN